MELGFVSRVFDWNEFERYLEKNVKKQELKSQLRYYRHPFRSDLRKKSEDLEKPNE